jgi:ubiquinone/menaquinone biosynthesis C-methylase UbiE
LTENIERLTASERAWWDSRAVHSATAADVVAVGARPMTMATRLWLDRVMTSMLVRAPGHRSCLDAGCGVGLYLPLLKRLFSEVIELDFSPNVLQRIPEDLRGVPHVKLVSGSLTNLPLGTQSLDAVFCRSTFQCLHAAVVPQALREFHRVLHPGGIVVLHFKNSHHLLYRMARMRSALRFWKRRNAASATDDAVEAGHDDPPGQVFHRPWHWYLRHCQTTGFRVEEELSWQFFYSGRMSKMAGGNAIEHAERWARRFPLIRRLIQRDGINYYVLLRKHDD